MSHLTPPSSFCCSTPDGTVQITASSLNCSFWTFEIQSPQGSVFFSDSSIYANGATASISTLPVGVYIVVVTETCDGNCFSEEFFAIGSACSNCGCTDPNALNFDYSAVYEDGTCLYPGGNCGCNDPNATNYNAAALCDDGSCLYDVVEPPCVPTYINDLIATTQLCAAKRGYTLLNKIRVGQEDQCSVLNAWKIILMGYLLNKIGNVYIGPSLNKHKVISKKSYSDNRITLAFDVVDEKTIKKSYKKYGEVDTNTSFIPIY